MDAIDRLMEEHRLIRRVLDALDAFASRVAAGGGDRAELSRFVTFVRDYADVRHHHKEEDVLFEAMAQAGVPRRGGAVGALLTDHGVGREHLNVLAERAAQAGPWSEEQRGIVVARARYLADLFRGHVDREDGDVYPMARARLTPELAARVDRECADLDARGRADGDRLEALGRELAEGRGVP